METDTVTQSKEATRGPSARINYAQAAVMLSQGLNVDEVAAVVGAKNGNSLRVGLSRRGVTPTATRRSDFVIQRATNVANTVLKAASDRLKEEMSGLLATHTGALSQIKPRANLKHIMRVGMALEPLVRSAKVVHGWGDEQAQGLIISMKEADPDTATVDVASVTSPVNELADPACAPDTGITTDIQPT